MKTNIKIPTNSIKIRILSAFMAFLILVLTFQQGFASWGLKVNAGTESDGIIRPIPDNSKYLGPNKSNKYDGDNNEYEYTGKIKPVAISLYDYMTDDEITNGWNRVTTNPDGAYTYYNRYNPYDKFNKKISDMASPGTRTIPASENITIVYKSLRFTNNDTVCVYLWNDDNSTPWPGINMTYDSRDGDFYVFKVDFNVGFIPDHLIFSNNGSDLYKSLDISQQMQAGHKYTFADQRDVNGHTGLILRTTDNNTSIRMHLWRDGYTTPWAWDDRPSIGQVHPSGSSYYYYPIPNLDAIKCTNNTVVELGFLPTNYKTYDNNDRYFDSFTIEPGYTYVFRNTSDGKKGVQISDGYPIKYPTDISCIDDKANSSVDIAVNNSKLYLGNFLASIAANPTGAPHTGNGTDNDDAASYTTAAKSNISPSTPNTGSYNDFYWQANMSQRPVTIWDSTQNENVKQEERPYAAIQGLVDSTLTDGKITQNNTPLPYFTNSLVSEGVMKAWESTASEPIAFPFYEVLRTADNKVEGFVPGTNTDVQHKARFYEFNSADANLHFVSTGTSGYFEETDTPILAAPKYRDSDTSPWYGKAGFFPFNTSGYWTDADGSSGKNLNYGFGAKFEMTFKLSADGKTDTVDQYGNKITTGAGKVSTRFNFSGDDDIWIFIDNKLVLDLGGDHAKTTGYIDFAAKTAVADKAITYGTGGADNLNIDGGSKSVDISSLIEGYNEETDTYNTDTIHTMTIFYMERGMAESNLLIRFNFPPESIYSKMKVKEQTDFSGVNEGLRNLTQKAAETDVFQYLVQNKGTTSADVLKENSYFPTGDTYIRTVQGTQTKLTPTTAIAGHKYFEPVNNGEYEGVKSVSYNWVDEYAKLNGTGDKMSSDKNIGNVTDSSGYMYLMHGVTSSGDAAEVKSSGEFEGQFKRYSLMKVTQQNTLYKPSAQDGTNVATLDNEHTYSPATGTPSRTVPNYYNLKRNFVFSTVSNEINISNGSPFNFRNNLQDSDITKGSGGSGEGEKDANENTTVAMTVQFVNEPKVGSITIKKTVKAPDGTAEDYKGEFTFKLTLSDIFGITGVNPDDTNNKYSDIAVTRLDKDNNTTTYPLYKLTDSNDGGYHGEFKLKAGESLIIANVPVQTHYTIVEDSTTTPNYEPSYSPNTTVNNTIVEGKLDESVPVSYIDVNNNGDYDEGTDTKTVNNSVIVNTHITSGLTLQKIVTASEGDPPAQNFTFRVSLTVPSEVILSNYTLTSSDNQTITVNTDSNGVKYFEVTVAGGSSVTVSGLPKGVGYTVSETDIPEYWEQIFATGLTGTIADSNTASITNRYNKPPDPVIKLTKVDVTSNNALITNPAQFKLLKLKDKDSSNNDIDWTNQTKLTAFNTLINGSGYTPAADADYIEAVYPTDASILQTTSGVLTVTNSTSGVTLTKGSKYIFYEVAAPTGFERDNTVTADKIMTLTYGDNFLEFPNSPSPLKVSVKKVDKDDPTKGLPGAEFDLYIHETEKTYPIVESNYKTASIATVPSPSANVPAPLPVLYPTNTNKSVSYEWSEGTSDPDYYYIKFKKPDGWGTVTMNGTVSADKVEGGYCYFKNSSDLTSIYFTDGTNRTIDINISSLLANTTIYPDAKHGYGYTFKPQSFTDPGGTVHATNATTDASGNYLVQIETPAPTSSNKVSVTEWNSTTSGGYTDYIWFFYDTSGTFSMQALYYNSSGSTVERHGDHVGVTVGSLTYHFYKFPYNSNYNYIMFYNQNSSDYFVIQPQSLTESMKGKVYTKGSYSGSNISNNKPPENNDVSGICGDFNGKSIGVFNCVDSTGLYANAQYFDNMGTTTYSVKTITYPTTAVSPSETTVNYSAKYQPEDRYAFITNLSGNTDINNFITIDTAMDDPYIMFYDSSNTAVMEKTANDKPVATAGLKLSVADKDGSDGSPYKIRLPKNAASFVVSSGADHTPNTENKILLYDGSHHHAGSTFYIEAALDNENKPTDDGVIDTSKPGSGKVKRIGYTTTKTDISYPINPKTDADYIFFKDTSNAFTGGSYVCAYYYGDVDGEYKPWPGVPAQRSYVDNDGKTVYVFQPPKSANGKYSKVIFNDGTSGNSRKITTAQDITLRTIYTTGSTTTAYGDQTTTPYTVTPSTKATASTTSYTIGSDYIYFNNNGTYTFSTGYGTSNRYILDDIHIEFFADLAGTVPVGTASPGYIPDKLSGTNVYKIAIPKGAAYFRVNNGDKSGVEDSSATVNNTRKSEIVKITPNGLFQFVEDTEAAKVWDGSSAASNISELDDHNYKLKDDFTATSTNIKLATVVTGNTAGYEGEQAYIKENSLRRKPNTSDIDIEYLDHTAADEGATNPQTFVKVKKPATTRSSVSEYEDSDTYYYWVETVAPTDYKLPEGDDAEQIIDMTSTTPSSPTSYDSTSEIYTNTFEDEPASGGTVILTKKSKDQVGINPIGTNLEDAQFKLVKLNDDGTVSDEIPKFREVSKGVYNYSSTGAWNSDNNTPLDLTDDKWLTTKNDGTLTLNNVPIGSYYLEEQVAPTGYSNYVNGTANKKTVYFSIGSNTTTKYLTCTDEMDAAYIRLFEHISEKKAAWGDPTFIFKITQTKYYDSTGTLQNVPTSKTSLVALTLNDADNTGKEGVSVLNSTYTDWLKEGTNESEYQGVYHIDSQRRIKVEPGEYEITRIPVSRYKFVNSASTTPYTGTTPTAQTETTNDTEHDYKKKVIISSLQAGNTVDVHYYDEVEYYDKFSHVDTNVNKFYKLESGQNKTVKGIRISDYRQVGTTGIGVDTNAGTMTVPVSNLQIYKIYVDGTEESMSSTEKEALTNFNVTYNYTTGDDKKFGGDNTYDPVIYAQFSYNTTDKQIIVTNASDFENGVYTLEADYNGFKATFDIVFLKTASP